MTVIELMSDPRVTAHALRWRALEHERVTLVAKVAFSFARGEATLRSSPPEPARLAEPVPIEEADLAPYLGRAEVLFRGRSFARAGGRVRLSVLRGAEMLLDKSLVASRHDPAGIPIAFERAYGGPGFAANPLGTGVAPGSAAPDFSHAADPRLPATFLPVPMAWATRASTLSDAHRAGLAASPTFIGEHFPWGALQSAPADQQLPSLECGDDILLENLIEAAPSVRLRLPAFQIRFDPGTGLSAPAARIDTLRIDGERRAGALVVRAVLPLAQPLARLAVNVGFVVPRSSGAQETADVEGDPSLRAVAPFPLGAPKEAPVDSIAAARALWRQSAMAPQIAGTRQPKTTTLNAAPAPTAAPPDQPARVSPVAMPPASATSGRPSAHPGPSAAPARAAALAPEPARPKGPSLGQQFLERSRKK